MKNRLCLTWTVSFRCSDVIYTISEKGHLHCIKCEDFHRFPCQEWHSDFFFFFFSTVCVVLVVHYHILSYKINLENFEPNSPLNVYWWHCWSHTMYTDKKEAWTKVMKIKLRGVVIVIPLKFEVWHLKFPSFQM